MRADDPRHGSRAGYNAGCRDECCRPHHLRYQKVSKLRLHREGPQWVDPKPTLDRIAKWGRYGVTPNALAAAAGLGDGTLRRPVTYGQRVSKSTERRVLRVTWDDLPDSAMVYADLTRLRITSAQAAGFPLKWFCAQVDGMVWNGNWRTSERVTAGVARAVLALYQNLPPQGPNRQAATLGRKRGYLPPAAWDDPGLLAMPKGWKPTVDRGSDHRTRDDIDEAVVLRVLAGERLRMTKAERAEVVRRALARGWSEEAIYEQTGIAKATDKSRYGQEDAA